MANRKTRHHRIGLGRLDLCDLRSPRKPRPIVYEGAQAKRIDSAELSRWASLPDDRG